jgi:hypothetical protein
VLEGAGLVERRDEFGVEVVGVVPLGLSRLAVLIIEALAGDPVLVVGGLIED